MRTAWSAAALGTLLILAGLGGVPGREVARGPGDAGGRGGGSHLRPRRSRPCRPCSARAPPYRERGDAGGLRALSPRLANTGLALIKAGPPHDLKRAHVARYQEGRAVFGGVLKHWVAVVEAGDDAAVLATFDELTDAYCGWLDASQGLAPARADLNTPGRMRPDRSGHGSFPVPSRSMTTSTPAYEHFPIEADALRWRCDPDSLRLRDDAGRRAARQRSSARRTPSRPCASAWR